MHPHLIKNHLLEQFWLSLPRFTRNAVEYEVVPLVRLEVVHLLIDLVHPGHPGHLCGQIPENVTF